MRWAQTHELAALYHSEAYIHSTSIADCEDLTVPCGRREGPVALRVDLDMPGAIKTGKG